MAPIPVYHNHEEDFVWRPGILDDEDTVAQATEKLAQTFIGIRVKPRPGKQLRMVHMERGAEMLDPGLKVKECIEPLSIIKLVWGPD